MCRETSCIESHSKSGFACEFKGSGCRPESLRPWMTWVRILAEVRFFYFYFIFFVFVTRVHRCLLSLQRLRCICLCACGTGVYAERVEGKQGRVSVTETGWWKLGSRSDACGSLEEQSVPSSTSSAWIFNDQRPRRGPEILPLCALHILLPLLHSNKEAGASCLCHVCGKHQGA